MLEASEALPIQPHDFATQIQEQNLLLAAYSSTQGAYIGPVFTDQVLQDESFFDEGGAFSEKKVQAAFPVRYEVYRYLQMHLEGAQVLSNEEFALCTNALSRLNQLRDFAEQQTALMAAGEVDDIR